MMDQILAMLGIEKQHIDGMKTAAVDFGARFTEVEKKIDHIYQTMAIINPPKQIEPHVVVANDQGGADAINAAVRNDVIADQGNNHAG